MTKNWSENFQSGWSDLQRIDFKIILGAIIALHERDHALVCDIAEASQYVRAGLTPSSMIRIGDIARHITPKESLCIP